MSRLALLLLSAFTVVTAAACGAHESSRSLQACVDRWNWTDMAGEYGGAFSDQPAALVRSHPCRVDIQYEPGSSNHFACVANSVGGFGCSEHAIGPIQSSYDPPFTKHNGRYNPRTGFLRLDHPPKVTPVAVEPKWMRRYQWDHGFIVPFDSQGRLEPGLVLRRYKDSFLSCPVAAPRSSPACGVGLYCFPARAHPRSGDLIACSFGGSRGSRIYYRARAA
jgi:hypothetical protein